MIQPCDTRFFYYPADHAATLAFYQQVVGLDTLGDTANETRLRHRANFWFEDSDGVRAFVYAPREEPIDART